MLPRQEAILKTIVHEYISTAQPVPSEVLAKKYLGLSPATIRNEMARLEAEGYIQRPHISAGGIPTDKAYRFYVETLEAKWELPPNEQRLIQHLFHQVGEQLEEWMRLAAAISAQLTQYASLVSLPKARPCRLHHLDLITLQDFLALMVLVLRQATLKEQLLHFEEAITQAELNAISHKINDSFSGLTYPQIAARGSHLPSAERQVMTTLVNMMHEEDNQELAEPFLEGLRGMLREPEFSRSERVANLLDVMESKRMLGNILSQLPHQPGIHVIIGEENMEKTLQGLSVVAAQYGSPGQASGIILVVGPTRMRYGHTMATVHHLASVLSGLLSELYGYGRSSLNN